MPNPAMIKLDLAEFEKHFRYEPETGLFYRLTTGGRRWKAGQVAGGKVAIGYIYLWLHGKQYPAHRVAYLMVHRELPDLEIDHINGIKDDNRICNLQLCTRQENACNIPNIHSITKRKVGGYFLKKDKKWKAKVQVNGKQITVGTFNTQEEANAAYRIAKAKLHWNCPRIV